MAPEVMTLEEAAEYLRYIPARFIGLSKTETARF
jgi:hypothetical protein